MRRHTTTAVLAVAAASLVLAGCSSSEDGTAAAAPSSSAASSSAAATSSASDSSAASGDASPEALAWAASFCSAAQPVVDATSAVSDPSSADMTTPEGAKDYIVGIYTTFAGAFSQTATAVSALDAPPVDGAEDFVPKASDAFTTAGQTFQGLADQASATDLTDPSALESLTSGLSTMSDPFQGAFTDLEASTPAELDTALSSAPECQAFNQ